MDNATRYLYGFVLTIFFGSFLVLGCNSQTRESEFLYPECEPRSNTDPGRLNLRAAAEDFGTIPPCRGSLEIYINKNSETRAVVLELDILTKEEDVLHDDQIRVNLEESQTGMFQKEVSLKSIEGESCRNIQITVRSMTCYSVDGSKVVCPDIRIIPPDAFSSIKVNNNSLNVCSAEL